MGVQQSSLPQPLPSLPPPSQPPPAQPPQAQPQEQDLTPGFNYEEVIKGVPYDVLLLILSHVPAQDLLKNCALVCKGWKDMVNHPSIWYMKCERAGRKLPSTSTLRDFRTLQRIYVKNPYGRNLVRNPCAKEGFTYWVVDENGGDQFAVEGPPFGHCDSLTTIPEVEEEEKDARAWATSYGWCSKHQLIDLLAEGCEEDILDKVKPGILVKELYASRFDCGCKYKFEASLLDAQKKVVKKFEFKTSFQQWENKAWKMVEHTFTDYDPGVRYVCVRHSGVDSQFWAGHYGSKFTMTTVKILLP